MFTPSSVTVPVLYMKFSLHHEEYAPLTKENTVLWGHVNLCQACKDNNTIWRYGVDKEAQKL